MVEELNGRTYYRPNEVCQTLGIHKTTLLRWIRNKTCEEAKYRDKRGWRLFTEEQLDKFKADANKLVEY